MPTFRHVINKPIVEVMPENIAFFSYSRVDSGFALKLAKDLRDAGIDLWIDQLDIKPGSHWDASIENGLNTSSCMLIILSPDSIASNNVMDEVSYGLECGKRIIPILLKECNTPFRLRRLQRIDFTGDYTIGFNQLLETLHHPVMDKANNPIGEIEPVKEVKLNTVTSTDHSTHAFAPAPPPEKTKRSKEILIQSTEPVQNLQGNQKYKQQKINQLHKQRIFSLIIAGISLIFIFLPWWSYDTSFFSYKINGFRNLGLLSVAGIVGVIIIVCAGDKTQLFAGKIKTIALISFGAIMMGAIAAIALPPALSGYGLSANSGIGLWLTLVSGLMGILVVSGLLKIKSQN
jgi:hypothetical protein